MMAGEKGLPHAAGIQAVPVRSAVGEKDQSRFEDDDYRLAAAALLIHAAMIDGAMSDGRAQPAASA